MEIEERFWAKVDWDLGDTERCWPWTASKMHRGYGQFRLGRVSGRQIVVRAHRLAYELEFGPIPEANDQGEPLHVDHSCHDPVVCQAGDLCPHRTCCNPHHLKLSTNRENHLPGRVDGRTGGLACADALGPERLKAKMDAMRAKRWSRR